MRLKKLTYSGVGLFLVVIISLKAYVAPADEMITALRDSGCEFAFSRNPDSSIWNRVAYGFFGYPALGIRHIKFNHASWEYAIRERSIQKLGYGLSVTLHDVESDAKQVSDFLSTGKVDTLTFQDCRALPQTGASFGRLRRLEFRNSVFVVPISTLLPSGTKLERLAVDSCAIPLPEGTWDVLVDTLSIKNVDQALAQQLVSCVHGIKTLVLEGLNDSALLAVVTKAPDTLVTDWKIDENIKERLRQSNPSIHIIDTLGEGH